MKFLPGMMLLLHHDVGDGRLIDLLQLLRLSAEVAAATPS